MSPFSSGKVTGFAVAVVTLTLPHGGSALRQPFGPRSSSSTERVAAESHATFIAETAEAAGRSVARLLEWEHERAYDAALIDPAPYLRACSVLFSTERQRARFSPAQGDLRAFGSA
jgi:hypothetical protein